MTIAPPLEKFEILPGIIGADPSMYKLAEQIKKIAKSDRPVLLKGETGTGKELFANAIHELSHRKGDIVAVNCSAIPENLFESLLFGHEKGAFTGADKQQNGFFAQASEGTLFLDEIAELPLIHQPKFLRALETQNFSRIGSNVKINFTGRIVAATHANLAQMTHDKLFREDLFYRLNIFELEIPSLEQRREDIPLLARHFARQQGVILSDCALDYLKYSSWPGNIRQLKNTIDKISVLAENDYLSAKCIQNLGICDQDKDLVSKIARELIAMPLENKICAIHDALVEEAVAVSNGNKTKAARLLGVHRKVIERRLMRIVNWR